MTQNKTILSGTAVLMASLFFGCGPHTTRQDEKEAMVDRYHHIRSTLMHDMAMSQLQTGDLQQAASSVSEGLMIDPEHVGLYILAGRIELERSRLDRSYDAFSKAIGFLTEPKLDENGEVIDPKAELPSETPLGKEQLAEACYYKAIVAQRWQRGEEALAGYERAFALKPENPSYLLANMELLVQLGQMDEALALGEANKDRFAQNASLIVTMAHLHQMQGDARQAVALFREAAVLDPDNTKVREEYAMALLGMGDIKTAATVLEEVLDDSDYKNRLDLHRTLAMLRRDLGQLAQARAIYVKLLKHPQVLFEDWVTTAELALADGDLGAALSMANRVISMNDRAPEGYVLAGLVWQRRGQIERALSMFDEAGKCSPGSVEPLLLRGMALQKHGQTVAAREAYESALKKDPDNVQAQRLLSAVAE